MSETLISTLSLKRKRVEEDCVAVLVDCLPLLAMTDEISKGIRLVRPGPGVGIDDRLRSDR
jgi:hypothetical protein